MTTMIKRECYFCGETIPSYESPYSDERGLMHGRCDSAEQFIMDYPEIARYILEHGNYIRPNQE